MPKKDHKQKEAKMLKAELDEHLDYEYGKEPLSINTRNGTSKKQLDHHMEI